MRIASILLATPLLLLANGCATPSSEPLAVRLQASPPDATVWLRVAGDDVTVATPIPTRSLPPEAARVVDSVQPGGEVEAWQEPDGSVLRVRSRYPPSTPAPLRIVRVTAGGEIVERMHSIEPAEIDEAARQRLQSLGLGRIEAAFAVAAADGSEGLHVVLQAADGARYVADTALDGSLRRLARLLDAEIEVELPGR